MARPHNAISITLYGGKPYAAMWAFEPLATGPASCRGVITAIVVKLSVAEFFACVAQTISRLARGDHGLPHHRPRLCDELFRHRLHARHGRGFGRRPVRAVSPFLGWVAVFLSGSDTSGNALFGNLQVVAAKQLNLNPVLFAATNSSGGVMGKMISPQNIATGVSVTNLKGHEGEVFARTFPHSIVLTILLGLLVAAQQYLIPWVIPVVK